MSKRIPRVDQLIKKELGALILKEIDFPKDVLATITRVETSPDLKESRVFISVFPENKREEAIKLLTREIYFLQKKINQRLKMKFLPRLRFISEEKTAEAGEIEEVLEKLKKAQ